MKPMKNRGARNAATPLDEVRTGKPNSNKNTSTNVSPQLVLFAYSVDRYSLVSGVFRTEASNE